MLKIDSDDHIFRVRSTSPTIQGTYGTKWEKPEEDLRRRIGKATNVFCLAFLLLWLSSVWKWPFEFLSEYMQVFFLLVVVFAYAGDLITARNGKSLLSKTATTSFELTLLVWIFAPSGSPWSLYLSYFAFAFVLLFVLSVGAGGSLLDKWERLSDRVGGLLHSIALIVVVSWLFGSKGLFSPIGLPPTLFSDYLLPISFVIYIIGSATKSASFPLRHIAIERASYSVAWGLLGSIFVTMLFRWLGFLSYSSLPDIERTLFLLFVGWLIMGIALSTTETVELRAKEKEVRNTWWWERFSKPIRESASKLNEELKGLKLSDTAYILPLGGQLVKTEKVSVGSKPDTIVIPLTLQGNEVGAVYIGSGEYSIDTEVKQFAEPFDGDLVIFTNPRTWQSIKSAQNLQAYPQEIKRAGFENLDEIKRLAEAKLSQFRSFGERVQAIEGRETAKYAHTQIPGINIEEGPGYERVRLPFIDVISDREGEYVRVGPIRVWESGSGSVVKFGPYLALDESVPEAISKPAKILLAIWDRSGSEIDIATLKDEVIFRKGTMRFHVKVGAVSFVDDGSAVRITRRLKEIRTPRLRLLVKPDVKALLVSGRFKFKALRSGAVFLRSRTGEVLKQRDTDLAMKLIAQLDETVDDLTRAVLEKRELEELAQFFSQVDEAFKEKESGE